MPNDNPQSPDLLNIPSQSASDVALALTKAAVQAIPIVGGLGAEVLALVMKAPIQKRQEQWMQDVGLAIRELSERTGKSFENLGSNEQFVSAVLHATQVALRSHQAEKLTALRNAVLNSALSTTTAADLHLMFFNCIDSLSPTHLRLLKFIQNPTRWLKEHDLDLWINQKGPGLPESWEKIDPMHRHFLEAILPDIKERREFYTQVLGDLMDAGLIQETLGLDIVQLDATAGWCPITELGNLFLSFIELPDSLKAVQ